MGGEADEGVPRVGLRGDEAGLVALEEQDAVGEDAGRVHHVAEAFGDVAEILADDDGSVGVAGLGEGGQHRLDGEADVGAFGGGGVARHQEELPERHRVVDAQRAGAAGGVVHQRAEGGGVGGGHADWGERGELPVLAGGGEVVGRGADADAGDGDVGVGPGARAVEQFADAKSR